MSSGIFSTDVRSFDEELFMVLKSEFPSESDTTIARFLIARHNDIDKAREMLTTHVQWRSVSLPIRKASCMGEILKGKFVSHGYDRAGHPVLYYRARLGDPWERDLDEAIRSAIWHFEVTLARLPADKSKITLVVDRQGVQQKNVDLELSKVCMAVMQNNFPERLHQCVVYPSGVMFFSLWNVVKWFLDPVTRSKVIPLMHKTALQQYVAPDQLIASLGGDAEVDFDPVNIAPDPYPEPGDEFKTP